jgi:hypothetical protein
MRRALFAAMIIAAWPALAAAQLGSYTKYNWTADCGGRRFGLRQVVSEGDHLRYTTIHFGFSEVNVGVSAPFLLSMIVVIGAGFLGPQLLSRSPTAAPPR